MPGDETFRARAGGRVITVTRHELVEVRPTTWAWLMTPKKFKSGPEKDFRVPRQVEFHISGITSMKWRRGWWIWPARLVIDVRPCNDPWSGRRRRPHRFSCAYRSAAEARLIRIAWVIQLAYVQANDGALLARGLPEQRQVPPPWWHRLLAAARPS